MAPPICPCSLCWEGIGHPPPKPKVPKPKSSSPKKHWYEKKEATKVWQRRRLSIESTASDAVPLRLSEK
ncbi:hypothetical protein PG990_003548 [Apiospora arundinis]|uniref:Uncharacterized protein n=1 Tax=Apiospora arundinis TaxID=335852 RepID=A0ABR2IFL9_9PEZI